MRWPTILFDFDGTLVDSIELILESYRQTMRVHRPEQDWPDDLWLRGLGTPLRVQFRHFTDDPAEVQAMIVTYREWNMANHDRMVTAYPGAVQAVKALKAAGARMGIVTSKNLHGLQRGLNLVGMEGVFESFVTSDSMDASKPDPEPVLAGIRELGGTPGRSVMVGDSPHDIAAGRDAGAATVACLWGPFTREQLAAERPDHWVSDFDQLLRLCDGTR